MTAGKSRENPPAAPGPVDKVSGRRVFAGIMLLLFVTWCGFMIVAAYELFHSDKVVEVEPDEVVARVASALADLGVTLPNPDPGAGPLASVAILKGQIRSRGGFRSSGGLNGDGLDGAWVELSPELAGRVRDALARSPKLKSSASDPPGGLAPDRWPKRWPETIRCYRYERLDDSYLMISDDGNQLWTLDSRS